MRNLNNNNFTNKLRQRVNVLTIERTMIKTKHFLTFPLFAIIIICCLAKGQAQPVPTPLQLRWHNAEMGAVFHYDLHVFDGVRYGQSDNRNSPIEDYNIFNPTQLDTDLWIKAAKSAGCKFAILTATHETGFGLWQSDVNPYCLKAVKWRDGKGDIVRDFVNSCHKYGVLPGIYVGIRWNSLLGIHNFSTDGGGQFAQNRQNWYRRYCERMVKELCTRYGDWFLIWFDGGADDPKGIGPDVEPIVEKYQPNCLFYHNVNRADFRWGGSETGTVGYPCWSAFPTPCSHHKGIETSPNWISLLKHGNRDGKYWLPAMADFPLRGANGRHEWFWEPDDDGNILSLDSLMTIYEKSVGRNATLIVGLTPDPSGLLPDGDVKRLDEWGKAIACAWGKPMAQTSGSKKQLQIRFHSACTLKGYRLKEDISQGEKIREYRIEAKTGGRWRVIAQGQSVGHQRLETIAPVNAQAVRLTITQSVGTPSVSDFSVY